VEAREAGAVLTEEFFEEMTDQLRREMSLVAALIGFPRGAGGNAERYVSETKVEGLGCDTAMPLQQMRALADATGAAVQGNLDPLLLVAGGAALDARIRETLDTLRGVPYIFNLGHGIVPHTPPEHVARLIEIVRSDKSGS